MAEHPEDAAAEAKALVDLPHLAEAWGEHELAGHCVTAGKDRAPLIVSHGGWQAHDHPPGGAGKQA